MAIVTSRTRSSPGTGLRVALAVAVAVILAAGGAACDRSGASSTEQPAPSASVVSIGVTLGTCSDLSQCESECDAGSADRCRRLAATYSFGRGTPKDEVQAVAHGG